MSENIEQNNPGDALRNARQSMGLSINDVSVSTKINARILAALEEGKLDDLPPKTFTRGFIRSYAQYLKIDPQPIIDAYNMDDPFISNQGKKIEETMDEAAKASSSDTPSTRTSMDVSTLGPKILLVVGITVLIVLIIGVKKVVDRYSQESITPAVVKTESGSPVLTAEPADKDKTDEAKTEEAAPAEAAPAEATTTDVTKDSPANETATTSATTETAPATAEKTAATMVEATPAATATPAVAPKPATPEPEKPKVEVKKAEEKPAPKKEQASAHPQEIILEALDKVDISFKVDGGSTKKISMKPESIYTIKAQESVQLEISDGGLVNVIQNGRSKGSAGDLGKATKLKFP